MHEMAIAQSLLKMAEEEITRQGCTRLEVVNVKYGALAGLVPESLQFCFETMIQGTPHEGARLEMEELPLQLHCPFCISGFGSEGHGCSWSTTAASTVGCWSTCFPLSYGSGMDGSP